MSGRGGVLVTGGASGIGAAAVRRFLADGFHVAAGDIDGGRLDRLRAEAAIGADRLVTVHMDVTDPGDAERLAEAAAALPDGLGVVCANAGVGRLEEPFERVPDAAIRTLVDVNLVGAIYTLRAAVPRLRDGGAIVVTGSTSGLQAHAGGAVYAATKIALVGLARSLAAELAPRRIRVNVVCPAGTDTALLQAVYGAEAPAMVREYATELNPLGRIAQPEDVADAIAFLATARHVNGVALRVDGGDALAGAI